QVYLLWLTAGQLQVINGLLVDVEHRGSSTVFRGHVGNGGPVADGQARRTFAEEFQVGTDHTLLTQELGNGQNNIGGGNARLALASPLHTHDIRQTHHGRAAQHHSFRFQTTHANGDNTQRINVRRMAVGTHTGIREGDRVTVLI